MRKTDPHAFHYIAFHLVLTMQNFAEEVNLSAAYGIPAERPGVADWQEMPGPRMSMSAFGERARHAVSMMELAHRNRMPGEKLGTMEPEPPHRAAVPQAIFDKGRASAAARSDAA